MNVIIDGVRYAPMQEKQFDGGMAATGGVTNRRAKLTEKDIPIIRRLLAEGETQQRIADRYGVAQFQISSIKRGKTWKHV